MGKAMFTIIGAMAELERSVIRERVQAGLDYARKNGTKSGRAIGRPRRIFDREKVCRLRESGLSIPKIATQMGLSIGTVAGVLKDATSSRGLSKTPR
jgi:DNA invertase Pin-like site-specific DNA recombinase